jgi:ParB-like chromosome segregation protein Spo0J
MGPFPRQYEATLAVRRPQPPDLQALPTGTYQISTAALAPHVQHDEINSGKNPDLLEAIRQNGIQEPLEVTTHADERGVVLRGGSHRVNAALALGIPTVPVQLHRMR